jgi:signal transduction histidine kinase
MLILPSPSSQWLISITLLGIAFIIAIMSIGYPFIVQIGIERDLAYVYSIGISAMVILPFIATHIIENTLSITSVIDIGGTLVIHIGGTIFAAALAYALYSMSKHDTTPYHTPVILLLVYWTIAESFLAISAIHPNPVVLSSNIPYILGGVVTIFTLTSSVRRMLNPDRSTKYHSGKSFIIAAVFFTLLLYVSIIGYIEIQPIIATDIPETTMNTGLLLTLTFLALYTLLTFLLLQLGIYGGKFSFDALAAGSTTIWLVIMTLKANFSTWSAGWWTAEILMGICIVIFSILLMKMYLEERTKTEELGNRAREYTEYLADQLLKHEERASESLRSLATDTGISDTSLDKISSAIREFAEVENITKNLAILVSAEHFPEEEIKPTDLIDSIQSGLVRINAEEQEVPVVLDGNKNPGECYVIASPLLADAFYNLFVGAIRHIGLLHSINVMVSPADCDPKSHWYCTLSLELTPAKHVEEHDLFSRYTSGMQWKVFEFGFAQRIVNLFGGYIQSGTTSSKGARFFVHFEIILRYAGEERE